ncbi:glyceraldehyde-3-phosphate dehydrogenase [Platysternon megacephalum]|uniref:Glyceraldehyde-3-phosphate dehydrogenase n=1 Tax=Platysternon megacephalum TaxID=55544 RepID=A0A4D9DE09_9SAUR|nr:glyceraldehyde-3-phosphate dehydrogenase [Platysternon megacephalum]
MAVVSSSPTPTKLFGEITSPNYPKPYPNNNISTWDITIPKGFVVKLNFWQFDLQPSESCLSDYVKGDQKLASFSAVCQDDGTWHRPMPRCEIVSCGDLENLTNGAFNYVSEHGNNYYQSAITYRCEEPYYRIVTNRGSGAQSPIRFEGW